MTTEREKPPIHKSPIGFDYGICGVVYHRGNDEFSTPSLLIPNREWSRGTHLVDTPKFIISLDVDVSSKQQLDDERTLELDKEGNVIGISFTSGKKGVRLDDLPISDNLKAEATELFNTYLKDENPEIEDYWRQLDSSKPTDQK